MKKSNVLRIFYFIGFLLLQMSSICVNVRFISNYLFVVKFISLFILLFCCIINVKASKLTFNKIFMIIILFFVGIVSYYITDDIIFLELFILLFASMSFEFNEIVKVDFVCKLLVMIFVLICNKMGYAQSDFIVTRDGNTIRNAFGFYHPNTFGMYVMMIFLDYLYLNKERKIRNIILAFVVAIFIHYTSDTRSAIYCIIGISSLLLFEKSLIKIVQIKPVKFILNNLYLILLCFSIVTTLLYCLKTDFSIQLNQFFSNRLYLQSIFWKNYKLSLFGNEMIYNYTLDNGYIKLLLNYGFLATIFYGYIYNKTLKKSWLFNDYVIYFIILILLFFNIAESSMLYVYFNIFILYFFCKDSYSGGEKNVK